MVVPPVTSISGVKIYLSGKFVVLETSFGLRVRFDGNHHADVTVPNSYNDVLCGLCGKNQCLLVIYWLCPISGITLDILIIYFNYWFQSKACLNLDVQPKTTSNQITVLTNNSVVSLYICCLNRKFQWKPKR